MADTNGAASNGVATNGNGSEFHDESAARARPRRPHHPGLSEGYGIVIGSKVKFFRDDPNNFGRYHHGNLVLKANNHNYRCAIDIDSNGQPDGHKWALIDVSPDDFDSITRLHEGWHKLKANDSSGALDYIRSPQFPRPIDWKAGDDKKAVAALESFIEDDSIKKYFVFGEPFKTGFGMHNIHQNQGSEIGGGHDAENGIYQDGGVLVQKEDGSMVAYLNKFSNQADETDEHGRPATGGNDEDGA